MKIRFTNPTVRLRRAVRACAGVVILIASVTGAAVCANLLPNGGMEEWPADTGLPSGWEQIRGATASVMHKDTHTKRSGEASLRFDLGGGDTEAWIAEGVGGIHPDTEYRLHGFYRTSPDAKLRIIVNVELNLGGRVLEPATDWIPLDLEFNSREVDHLSVQLRLNGTGSAWFDGLELVRSGEPGATVAADRAELLRLTSYQRRTADPASNTDAWTAPFQRLHASDARSRLPLAERSFEPHWKVGQWARYLCTDDLMVRAGKGTKSPQITLIDCKITGTEKVNGKTYFWYQSVVRVRRWWAEKTDGSADTGEKILVDIPRKAVLSLLVDGPRFQDIQRYLLKVDQEPLLEYTDGTRAALPWLNIDHLLIRPVGLTDKGDVRALPVLSSSVPVTGMVSFDYHGPQLDRRAALINWGQSGAVDGLAGENPVRVRLAHPPYLAVALDGFGGLKEYQELAAAGVELFQNQRVPYLGEARKMFNQLGAYFYNDSVWATDQFDIARSNMVGWGGFLDEPYYRQRRFKETVKQAASAVEAARVYSSSISAKVDPRRRWPGETLADYDAPASVSWYSARAGAPGFVLENARLSAEMEDIKRVTGHDGQRELADAIDIACMAGTARRFGVWWGQGLYKWTPERYYKEELEYYARNGARYLGFWIEGGAEHQDPDLNFYRTVLGMIPDLKKAIHAAAGYRPKAEALILTPDGYVLGLAGTDVDKPWGIVDAPGGRKLTDAVIRKAAELFQQGVTFDIMVDDPDHRPDTSGYSRVFRFTFDGAPGE